MMNGYKQPLQLLSRRRLVGPSSSMSSIVVSNNNNNNNNRRFISNTASLHLSYVQNKFANLFLDVKERNMGETLFSRYIREMVHAVDLNNDGMISEDELLHMMEHMSVERALTSSELQILFEELGSSRNSNNNTSSVKEIATHDVEELVLQKLHESETSTDTTTTTTSTTSAVA